MSALFQIRRNLAVNSFVKTKLDSFTGYIVPIVTDASQAWRLNRQNLQEIEHIQKVASDESAETTRQAQRGEFKVPKSRLRKTDEVFFDEPKYCSTTSC